MSPEQELILTATIENVVFANPDTGFAVVRTAVEGEGEPVVAAGPLGDARPGETMRLSGTFEEHPRFGRRFRVAAAVPVTPSTEDGIRKLLACGRFKGIGRKTADHIVSALGARSLDALVSEGGPPSVPGVPRKRLLALSAALRSERARVDTITFLAGLGLTIRLASSALDVLGGEAARKVRANPYCLAFAVDGIGFPTADRVAAGVGVFGNHPLRLEAGILYALSALADDGHVCVSRDHLLRRAETMLAADLGPLESALDALVQRGLAVAESSFDDVAYAYLPDLFEAETDVAAMIRDSAARAPILLPESDLEAPLPGHLSQEQREAVMLLLTHGVAILTGGPGVGKTTVIQALAEAARSLRRKVVLAAPTGRAARRITETSGLEAHTIHKLLGLRPGSGRVQALPTLRVDADAVIVDEASMIDLKLFAHMLRQLEPSAALILVGDKDQLPSVGPGDVLNDLISSGAVPVARLERIFRQESAGLIVRNAHRALAGIPPVSPPPGQLADFYFMEREDPAEAADLVRDLVTSRLPNRMGFDPRSDIQVLTPMYRGQVGADNLNRKLQEALGAGAASATRGEATLKVGDRVIYTRNDYERELANGDLGRVTAVEASGAVVVRFGDATHRFEAWRDLRLAFALTVHKSQGSEYPVVILPVFFEHRAMLRRAVIYTAMTRARKLLVIVGQPGALARALSETRRDARGSLLARRLATAAGAGGILEGGDDAGGALEEDFGA